MKNILIIVFTGWTITAGAQIDTATKNYGAADKQFKKQLNTALEAYYDVKDAFVASNTTTTKKTGEDFIKALNTISTAKLSAIQKSFFETHKNFIAKQAGKITTLADIEQQRAAFDSVSQSLYVLVKSFKANSQTVYHQYCPMAFNGRGAYWMSDEEKVMNPYFGSKMLHCGGVEEEF